MLADLWSQTLLALADIMAPHGPVVAGVKTLAPNDFSIRFFLQLAFIILACRVVGWLGQRFLGQSQVVGEMVAGVILGPSLLGLFWPDFQAMLFPQESRSVLYAGAQLGVGLYMFLVGTTLRLDHFGTKAKSACGVSIAGITAPFIVAALITPMLLTVPGLFAPGLSIGSATCSWAPALHSRLSPCWRGSSTSGALPTPLWGRSR